MPQINEIKDEFADLAIWQHFINGSGASIEDVAMVKKHISRTMPLLDRYNETFPKFTLHNSRHQKNIVKIMGDLLGPDVSKLSGLECSMLLLSAVYHDIGMVFKSSELNDIGNERNFHIFLEKHSKAMLEFEENDRQPTAELIEWYCRWMHADRVWIYLNSTPQDIQLKWGNAVIKQHLGYLCESHNMWVDDIIAVNERFHNDYLGKCDLMFCVILLRLADILDFDNSRTPKSVYEFLDLDNPKNKLDSVSKIEWEKHLNSDGFQFRRNGDVVEAIFSATTDHPNIEAAIKDFIGTINSELLACNKLRRFCSVKWQNQPLPQEIDTLNLISDNYQSGDYHFSLSQEKILTLLTGDGLYNDDFVFIRELLQNAIDTSRHREFHERQFNPNFSVKPIQVSFFTDSFGYQWIRIDDFGMGMNEDIIKNHLLKKGESYYNSDQFKLEKIQINKKLEKDFVPISRFGIGLLSCFMAGDRIEISTKHASAHSDTFRLAIEGRNGHYILQSLGKHHNPIPMPAEFTSNETYRQEIGTSIAVRITTNKEFIGFDLLEKLKDYVVCSPIKIFYKNKVVGGDFDEMVNTPWAENESIALEQVFVEKIENTFKIKFKKGLNIVIENINITQQSSDPNLKGQLLFLAIQGEYESIELNQYVGFRFTGSHDSLSLKVYSFKKDSKQKENEIEVSEDISSLLSKLRIFYRSIVDPFTGDKYLKSDTFLLSHNGIALNDSKNIFALQNHTLNKKYSYPSHSNNSFLYSGVIYFQDSLLPELTVSRNEVKGLSFKLIANLCFSLEPLNKFIVNSYNKFDFFKFQTSGRKEITSLEIKKSEFYEKNRKLVDKYIKVEVDSNLYSIDQAKEKSIQLVPFSLTLQPWNFFDMLKAYVIEQNFEVSICLNSDKSYKHLMITTRNTPFPYALLDFTPMTFVKFEENDQRLILNSKINTDHPFVRWYIKAESILKADYFYYSKQLIYALTSNQHPRIILERCNKILDKLNIILMEDLKPYKMFTLKESDLV